MLKRKTINFSIFVIFSVLLEGTAFAFAGLPFFQPFFYTEIFLFIFAGSFIFIFNNTLMDRIYLPILLFINTLLLIVNDLYYLGTGVIFSIQNIGMAKQFKWEVVAQYFKPNIMITLIVLMAVADFLIIFVNTKWKVKKLTKKANKKKLKLISSLSVVGALAVSLSSIAIATTFDKNVKNNYTAENVSLSANYNYSRYGMFTYYLKEIFELYIKKNTISDNQISNYLKDVKYTTSKMTGVCKDMNVITIMIETGAMDMVNKTLTPTLYEYLYGENKGINFNNNYQKNPTGVSEMVAITGNYPAVSRYTTDISCKTPFSLPSLLNDEYTTIYCHDVGPKRDMYNRSTIMKNVGFKNTCFHDELYPDGSVPEWEWNRFTFDTENTTGLLNYLDKIKATENKFYLHYTTLNMHMQYSFDDSDWYYQKLLNTNNHGIKLNEAKTSGAYVNPLEGTNDAKRFDTYMLKCMDFDDSLKMIQDYLNSKGIEDNTLLVLYGDHDIYGKAEDGNPLSYKLKKVNNSKEIKLYDTVMTMYNKTLMEKMTEIYNTKDYNNFTCVDMIVPTILDLLGIKYCPNIYFGKSIFSDSYNKNMPMYSYEICSYLNDHYLSDIGNAIDKTFFDNNTQDDFILNCGEYNERRNFIDAIYKNNFFSRNQLKNYIIDN